MTTLRRRFAPAGYRRSAAAVLAREVGEQLEFALLGDVRCLIATAEDVIDLIDPRLIELDGQAEVLGTRQALVDNRAKANTDAGYPIFADDPRASAHLTTVTLDTLHVSGFLLLSDGGWRHLDARPQVAFESLQQGELAAAFDREVERSGQPQADDVTILRFSR